MPRIHAKRLNLAIRAKHSKFARRKPKPNMPNRSIHWSLDELRILMNMIKHHGVQQFKDCVSSLTGG